MTLRPFLARLLAASLALPCWAALAGGVLAQDATKPAETAPAPALANPAEPAPPAAPEPPKAAAAPTGADDHRAAAVALLDQLHPTDAVNAMMPSIIQQIRLNLTHGDPDLVQAFNAFAPQLAAEGEAAKPDLIDRIVDVYAKTFTTEELKAITVFYQSTTGQKMIATQAQVTGDTMVVVRDWGTKLANQMFVEARTKLQAPQP